MYRFTVQSAEFLVGLVQDLLGGGGAVHLGISGFTLE